MSRMWPPGNRALTTDIEPYVAAKGTPRFPLADPNPLDLIGRIAAELPGERVTGPG
ncbi:MAG: hypothetical protein HY262_10400 [Chloroflexi bacterium]|nr:hypothetical protein [Chloroflexota bacterium]